MRVSEERLTTVLTRSDTSSHTLETNPVGGLIVESIAAACPDHATAVRRVGEVFLDLVRTNDEDAIRLSLPVVTQVLSQEEMLPVTDMRVYLAEVAARDYLFLGLCIHALLPQSEVTSQGSAAERDAVVRVLYLLVRMFETQEEADALDADFER